MMTPFDSSKLDRLLEKAGADLLISVSKHNIQYLLGGYRYFFFAHGDAFATDRYLPILGYVPNKLEEAFYVGAGNETWGLEVHPIWPANIVTRSWTSIDAAATAAELIRKLGIDARRIAVEFSFLPADAMEVFRRELPDAQFISAFPVLEELRAVKNQEELRHIKDGAAAIVDAMLATFRSGSPGLTEAELVERLRIEQSQRGLIFDYALVTSGLKFGRAPSSRPWSSGEVLSLDTAGYRHGYLADMARMAVLGRPTQLMQDLLDEIRFVQDQARVAVAPGRVGKEVYQASNAAIEKCTFGKSFGFVAHGMGLISHEAPRLRHNDEIGYEGAYAERPLEPGMVLSIETGIKHPEAGFVKLEDTLAVTESGWEAYGDWGRSWNQV